LASLSFQCHPNFGCHWRKHCSLAIHPPRDTIHHHAINLDASCLPDLVVVSVMTAAP
jgi:hypothetical protein